MMNIIGTCAFWILVYILISNIIKSIKTQEIQEIGFPIWKGLCFKDYPSLFVLYLGLYVSLLIFFSLFCSNKYFFSFLFLFAYLSIFQFAYPTILLFTSKFIDRKQNIIYVYSKKEKPFQFYFTVILNYIFGILALAILCIIILAFAVFT